MVSRAVWKTWPLGLSYDKNLGLRPRFLSTESLGPCFSHGTGDHDQILQQAITWANVDLVPCRYMNVIRPQWVNLHIYNKGVCSQMSWWVVTILKVSRHKNKTRGLSAYIVPLLNHLINLHITRMFAVSWSLLATHFTTAMRNVIVTILRVTGFTWIKKIIFITMNKLCMIFSM